MTTDNPASGSNSLRHLPNALTVLRIGAAIGLLACIMLAPPERHLIAMGLFLAASLSDFLDGYLARKLSAHSAFGETWDPIADKALMGASLFLLVLWGVYEGWLLVPVFAILLREVAIMVLRHRSPTSSLPVSTLAKLKTALQFLAVFAGFAVLVWPQSPFIPHTVGMALWLAAGLTVFTGLQYVHKLSASPAAEKTE